VPPVGALTFQLMPLPVALVVLAKPVPVNPALLLSIVPFTLQKPVVFSWIVAEPVPPELELLEEELLLELLELDEELELLEDEELLLLLEDELLEPPPTT
jgi:hypothetical protein